MAYKVLLILRLAHAVAETVLWLTCTVLSIHSFAWEIPATQCCMSLPAVTASVRMWAVIQRRLL